MLYWFVTNRSIKIQNILLLIASYIFYGWWDWKFLSLILISTLVDYTIGVKLEGASTERERKILLWSSILINLGVLGIFKYYNFFVENFIEAFTAFGFQFNAPILNIILPVGISFYTFQTLSYTIDVYKGKLAPTKDFIAFATFVSFFPQLVAGPIERASNLLPQFYTKRSFDKATAVDGLRQMLWGFFKKMVIADNCAYFANEIFNNYNDYSGSTLAIGALMFTFQIYGDFSGYSDIAIGTSRLFGFNLMKNFAFPYFSRDIAEFWRRWHISLSTWFRDYVYIPLGGSKGGLSLKIRNTFIIFLVSGFWHGANWTFIVWGALNAIYFLPVMLSKRNRNNLDTVALGRLVPNFRDIMSIVFTFSLTVLAWVFFRAENLDHAFNYLAGIFHATLFQRPEILPLGLFCLIIGFVIMEWLHRNQEHGLQKFEHSHRVYKYMDLLLIFVIVWSIIIWNAQKEVEFIYFQF